MKGNVLQQVSFIHVAWPWVAFPAAIVALAAVSLGFSIALVWKSSALALLLHDVEGWTPAELKRKKKLLSMDEAANEWWVHFTNDRNGGNAFLKS